MVFIYLKANFMLIKKGTKVLLVLRILWYEIIVCYFQLILVRDQKFF